MLEDEHDHFAGAEACARVGAGVAGGANDQIPVGDGEIILAGVLENEGGL